MALPFQIAFEQGTPLSHQVVYAVKKAIVSGKMRPGDRFPSVRALSRELQINPNTAHKVVALLTADGLLQVNPGIGMVVAEPAGSNPSIRARLIKKELEKVVVDAKNAGFELEDVTAAIAYHWAQMS
jgi:GntR family transcriptional regulator